ncbi:MAG: hypothetical protein LBN33_04640 [Desulfovibrio sp.]|jgi:hypothetical protein|nr:hypothetical protein [Desulfovibrio sp.]
MDEGAIQGEPKVNSEKRPARITLHNQGSGVWRGKSRFVGEKGTYRLWKFSGKPLHFLKRQAGKFDNCFVRHFFLQKIFCNFVHAFLLTFLQAFAVSALLPVCFIPARHFFIFRQPPGFLIRAQVLDNFPCFC